LRVASEKAKATADQQTTLVTAEINVQASLQKAEAARNEGVGERDKLAAIAEGQQKQMAVLGADATVRLRQYELVVGKAFDFINAHPEVLTAALSNAQKFVPQVSIGGSSGGGLSDMLLALVGQQLSKGSALPTNVDRPTTGSAGATPQQ
jgi:hypothetical protein